jgi:hypothetical protein
MYPDWAEKLLWGAKVRGLRVTLASAEAAPVKALVLQAYEQRAQVR